MVGRRQHHLIKGSNAKAMAAPATETFATLITALVFVYAGWRASTASNASVARPVGWDSIEWTGSVEPVNAINGDTWINTT